MGSSFRCLTFLTDYGLDDGFVAACRGVAAKIAPDASVIDVTHLVPAGDVRRGAVVLAQTLPYFPPAVHVAVVDPGVGTSRRAVAVAAGESLLVGPDNGLLPWAAAALGGARRAVEASNAKLWLSPVSHTFHGRDIFMPVGAHLAAGADLDSVGNEIDIAELVTLPAPTSRVDDGTVESEVLTVDGFGNVQLSVTASDAQQAGIHYGGTVVVRCGDREIRVPYREMFGAVPQGDLIVHADGAGMLSLAVNAGHAARRLGLEPGDRVSFSVAS